MCMITVLKPLIETKQALPTKELNNAWCWNNDGGGFAYVENKTVKFNKGIFKFDNFIKKVAKKRIENPNSYFVLHCRNATSGDTRSQANCHPFVIKSGESVLFHNGTILDFKNYKNKKSDSRLFTEWTKELPSNWYENEGYMKLIQNYIGKNNKIAVLNNKNVVWLINKNGWYTENEIVYSSDYYKKKIVTTNHSNVVDFLRCKKCKLELITVREKSHGLCESCIETDEQYTKNVYNHDDSCTYY